MRNLTNHYQAGSGGEVKGVQDNLRCQLAVQKKGKPLWASEREDNCQFVDQPHLRPTVGSNARLHWI